MGWVRVRRRARLEVGREVEGRGWRLWAREKVVRDGGC